METRAAAHHRPTIAYRADIDGLRAVAVLAVLINHAYPSYLPGGFISVDVFFVISGFLISSILLKECTQGRFSYTQFYTRRIRRLLPVLILMLVLTCILSIMLLVAEALKKMATTMLASILFGANIQLMLLEKGYSDDSMHENPLLHLWSLGVEEQFYIFWPCFIAVLARPTTSVTRAIVMQLVVALLSFTCNVVLLPYGDAHKYSFYFPLSRFWQMSLGGLVAYYFHLTNAVRDSGHRIDDVNERSSMYHSPTAVVVEVVTAAGSLEASSSDTNRRAHNHHPRDEGSAILMHRQFDHPLVRAACSWVGLAFIIAGFVLVGNQHPASAFPGFWALLPTCGAALFIFAGHHHHDRHPAVFLNHTVFSFAPIVFIGKVSYALYLLHWPLLVFAKLQYPDPTLRPTIIRPWAICIWSFLLSILSYYAVETPLRRHKPAREPPSVAPPTYTTTDDTKSHENVAGNHHGNDETTHSDAKANPRRLHVNHPANRDLVSRSTHAHKQARTHLTKEMKWWYVPLTLLGCMLLLAIWAGLMIEMPTSFSVTQQRRDRAMRDAQKVTLLPNMNNTGTEWTYDTTCQTDMH
jgi:peptidoglycan/LPS O-acetylase OafA/YrhL